MPKYWFKALTIGSGPSGHTATILIPRAIRTRPAKHLENDKGRSASYTIANFMLINAR